MIIHELTIPRPQWLCGEGSPQSMLLRLHDMKRCCLGHFGKACGLTDDEMAGLSTPYALATSVAAKCPQISGVSDDDVIAKLMTDNDDPRMVDSEREMRIEEGMLKLSPPVKVTFVD